MKAIKLYIIILFTVAVGANTQAQTHDHSKMITVKTDTVKVLGNCDMCKSRIEGAVKSEGAGAAVWNATNKLLVVSYDPSKTNVDILLKKVAAVGHDSEKYKAEDKVYNSLPACCKYERGKF
mgnify:CR=1 FL=1